MKIISIDDNIRSSVFNENIINRSLKNGLFGDDYINDNSFIFFKVQFENRKDYESFLYRRLWECIYLKSSEYSYILDNDKGIAILKISLSEALNLFRSSLLPPILKKKLGEYTESIDHIITVLNDIFFDELTWERNTGQFKKLISFNPFEHVSNYNMNRTNKIISICNLSSICDVIASNVNISQIINGCDDDISMVCVITTKDIRSLCYALDNSINVTSLIVNPTTGYSVKCVIDKFNHNPYIINLIKNTYEKLK